MDFAAGVYLSEPPPYRYLPPYTLYTCILYTVYCILYTYSHREGGRGGEMNQREGWRGSRSQSWVENTDMPDCITSL